jgi:hypothetical protein
MEMRGLEPNWSACQRFNCPENQLVIKQIKETFTIAPNEFRPEGAKEWKGLPFWWWYEHIISN